MGVDYGFFLEEDYSVVKSHAHVIFIFGAFDDGGWFLQDGKVPKATDSKHGMNEAYGIWNHFSNGFTGGA